MAIYTPRINGRSIVALAFADLAKAERAEKRARKAEEPKTAQAKKRPAAKKAKRKA